MKLHRFYWHDENTKNGPIELRRSIWVDDPRLMNQWIKVLRFQVGNELVLFDGESADKLYKISEIEPGNAIHLDLVTEMDRKLPKRHIYLFWSLLKKDKNDWVLQKCTELGVTNFVPILSERTEKTGFDEERARKIVIEAAEQCGRSDIPQVREPINLQTALDEFKDKIKLFVAEQGEEGELALEPEEAVGVLIGPEGGWTDAEKEIFKISGLAHLNLHDFTLRAETACLAAVTVLTAKS